MWFRQSGQHVRGPGGQKEQMGRLLAPPGPGLPQSQAPRAGSPRVPVPRHRGASSRNRDPQARWRLSALLKCPCCLCCVGLAEPCFIQELLRFVGLWGELVTSANTVRLGGPMFGLLGCVNLGTSARFSEATAGPPVD